MIGDLDAELAQAEAKARELKAQSDARLHQLRQARQHRRDEIKMKLAAIENEYDAVSFRQQERRVPDANADERVRQLCNEWNTAIEAIAEFARQHHDVTRSAPQRVEYYVKHEAELAQLREAARAARFRYEQTHRVKHEELCAAADEAKLNAVARAADLRAEIATLKDELTRMGS
jgi:hypothetical protein